MKLNKLNTRIKINKIDNQIVNGRRQEDKEIEFYSCWAEILDLFGKELYEAINIKLENTIVFKVRHCELLKQLRTKENFIVEWENRKYKIYHVDFKKNEKKFIHIKCNEVT